MNAIHMIETRWQGGQEPWIFSRGSERMVGSKMGLVARCRWDASHSTAVRVRAGGMLDFRRGRRGRAELPTSDWSTFCVEKC